jgi:hypothetical protein
MRKNDLSMPEAVTIPDLNFSFTEGGSVTYSGIVALMAQNAFRDGEVLYGYASPTEDENFFIPPDKQPLFEEIVREIVDRLSMERVDGDIGITPDGKFAREDGMQRLYMSDTSVLNVSVYVRGTSLQAQTSFYSTDPDLGHVFEKLVQFYKLNQKPIPPPEPEREGSVYCLVTTRSGMSFKDIGSIYMPFEPKNYPADVVADYEFVVKDIASVMPNGRLALMASEPGCGKCWGRDTEILMHDGSIKKVQDIVAGEFVMGPDSTPRRVLRTNTGTGPLFKIVPTKGQPWICNDVHVLTLVSNDAKSKDGIIDIPLNEYLTKTDAFKHHHKLFRVPVTFPVQEKLPLDPYFLGLWFGDGTKDLKSVGISKPDREVLDTCRSIAKQFGLVISTSISSNGCPTHRLAQEELTRSTPNKLAQLLKSVVGEGINVPQKYLTASTEERLEFLAGWLDSDGALCGTNCYDFIQKRKDYSDAVAFLARSVGLAAYVTECEKTCQNDFTGTYYRVSISGDTSIIPMRIPRKMAAMRQQIKSALRTGFEVESIGDGEYFGFTLEGDGRLVMGDFTVGHNTKMIESIIYNARNDAVIPIFVPAHEVEHVGSPDFLRALMELNGSRKLIVLEDADLALTKRKKGTPGADLKSIAALLNLTDGILGNTLDLYFLVTTNAELPELDPAITRPGRLSKLIAPKKLTAVEAEECFLHHTETHRTFSEPMTLAAVYEQIRAHRAKQLVLPVE